MSTTGCSHTTKDGHKMLIAEMSDSHLANTIRYIERRADKGVILTHATGTGPDDFYLDREELYSKAALRYLGYEKYTNEQKRRDKLHAGWKDVKEGTY